MATCPHCFNTIANEYPQLGGNYEVIHHTQLLARLVDEGKLTPVGRGRREVPTTTRASWAGTTRSTRRRGSSSTRCPASEAEEMQRCKERGFCCGAGGARMWMEERIGKRINTERIEEALALNPDTIFTGCPYCMAMLGDAVAAKKGSGRRQETLEVIDVAQLLARSVALQRPPVNGSGSGATITADAESGVDAAPPGDVTSAAEGEPTTGGAEPPA